MEGCVTGILIEIDTNDNNEKCKDTNSRMLSEWDFIEEMDMTLKKYKSKSVNCPLKEKNQNHHKVGSRLLELNNYPFRRNSCVPVVETNLDASSRNKNKEKLNEDLWKSIVNCDGDLLLENEKFDFSISLSDDTSRTDDDVFYTQSESSTDERKAKAAMRKQTKKAADDKEIHRNRNKNKENFEDDLQNSLREKAMSVNLVAKPSESNKENEGLKISKGCTLVRQSTFTLSTASDSSSTSKNQEERTNHDDMRNVHAKNSKSNIGLRVQCRKPLSKTAEIRSRNSIEKQPKSTNSDFLSKKISPKNTRSTVTKRILKESELLNSKLHESQASKKSDISNLSLRGSHNGSSQSKTIGTKTRNLTPNGKCIKQPEVRKHAPVKATLPVRQMTKSRLQPPSTYSATAKAELKITKSSSLSKAPCSLQLSSDNSLSFTPLRRSLNISSVPTLTSTPNRRSVANCSMSSTPSVRPFAKTPGLPTPIRLLSSSDMKM